MKLDLIFIGNKFVYNTSLKEYVLRSIQKQSDFIDSIRYFKSSDNSLFLYLQEQLESGNRILIITNKKNFSTIGKLLCTATSDNQVLKDGLLVPQKTLKSTERSYLLKNGETEINVLQIDESQKMPELLLPARSVKSRVHIFNENKESISNILSPIAQMHEVTFVVTSEVEGWLQVDISSNPYGDISQFIEGAKKLLPRKLITASNIIEHIIDRLSSADKKVSFAESCTGGLLAYYFTQVNGASSILEGSLVTYSNLLKENWLAVGHETLEVNGAVSQEVVQEMSEGALNVSSADYALSISGIAGDGGGSVEKPVGTVHIGVRSKDGHEEEQLHFFGDRNYVQHQSALYAIKMLILSDIEMFF